MTRVNLLVGRNNSGKTSILEAAEILAARGAPWSLLRSPTRRKEVGVLGAEPPRRFRPTVDVRHLFHGHKADPGASFRLEGKNRGLRFVETRVDTWKGRPSPERQIVDEEGDLEPLSALTIQNEHRAEPVTLPLSGAALSIDDVRPSRLDDEADEQVNYVGTTDVEYRLGEFWDRIVLTPNEDRVVEALQIIAPEVERIASLSRSSGRGQTGSIVLKLSGSDDRMPIGSHGEGLKRLLVLAVNLVNVPGGLLLVDEIDTGLHFSVLAHMWKLLIEVARNLDVQVLATTHSLDCLRALARTVEKHPALGDDVSVFRVQRGHESATRYSAEEILSAVEHDMEIR